MPYLTLKDREMWLFSLLRKSLASLFITFQDHFYLKVWGIPLKRWWSFGPNFLIMKESITLKKKIDSWTMQQKFVGWGKLGVMMVIQQKNIFLTNTFSRFRQRYNFPLQIKSIVKYIWLVANAQRIYYINNYLSFPLYTLTNTMNVFVL